MEDGKQIKSYRDLRVFKRSYAMELEIHRITQKFPAQERYELGSQLRRAATSIPMNRAEGYGRKRFPDEFKRFLGFAGGSCNEVSVVLSLARDLGYLEAETYAALEKECEEVGKGINKLIQVWR
jgi:four helix bundle protein